jgi:quinol monooxygenase YgiN
MLRGAALPIVALTACVCGAAATAAALLWSQRRRRRRHGGAIVLVVHLTLAPGRRAAFARLWGGYAAYVAAHEPGVLSYTAAAAEAAPDELVLYQRYASKEALALHQRSAAYREFGIRLNAGEYVLRKSGELFVELEEEEGFL